MGWKKLFFFCLLPTYLPTGNGYFLTQSLVSCHCSFAVRTEELEEKNHPKMGFSKGKIS